MVELKDASAVLQLFPCRAALLPNVSKHSSRDLSPFTDLEVWIELLESTGRATLSIPLRVPAKRKDQADAWGAHLSAPESKFQLWLGISFVSSVHLSDFSCQLKECTGGHGKQQPTVATLQIIPPQPLLLPRCLFGCQYDPWGMFPFQAPLAPAAPDSLIHQHCSQTIHCCEWIP